MKTVMTTSHLQRSTHCTNQTHVLSHNPKYFFITLHLRIGLVQEQDNV